MWQILKNCLLVILPGGITSYEAAYAGLPSINLLADEKKYFLIKELVESKVSIYEHSPEEEYAPINKRIETLYNNKVDLLKMHLNTKNLIRDKGGKAILDICLKHLNDQNAVL